VHVDPHILVGMWVSFDDPFALLSKVLAPPWEGEQPDELPHTCKPAAWERQHACSRDWEHDLLWCGRAEGSVAIHRFRLRDHALARELAAGMQALALEERSRGSSGDQASNVGGFHGARDLWERPEVHETGLPQLVRCAVRHAAAAEAAALRRPPIFTTADEAWWNALPPGCWNALHTHAGSTYSGVVYASGGSPRGSLAGRLALLPSAPQSLSPDQRQIHVRAATTTDGLAAAPPLRPTDAPYLLLEPAPGTCIVFPSFVPHFVLPTPAAREAAAEATPEAAAETAVEAEESGEVPLRVSLAFNFGSTEPVMAQVFTLGKRVRLVLEATC